MYPFVTGHLYCICKQNVAISQVRDNKVLSIYLPLLTVIASVRVTARSENALALEWETFPPIDSFQLLYSPLDGTSPSPSLFPSFQTTFTLEGLTAGIEYHVILEKSEGSVVSVIDAFSCFTRKYFGHECL